MNDRQRSQWGEELGTLSTVQLAALVALEPDLTHEELELIYEIARERLADGDDEARGVILETTSKIKFA